MERYLIVNWILAGVNTVCWLAFAVVLLWKHGGTMKREFAFWWAERRYQRALKRNNKKGLHH